MEANSRQWYVRWFFWSQDILDEFFEKNRSWKYRDGVNLCPMMRVMLIYAPLVLFLHLVVYGAIFATVTVVPIYFYGWHGYVSVLEWVAGAAVVITILVFAAKALDALHSKWSAARAKRKKEAEPPPKKPKPVEAAPAVPKGPGFWEVVGNYLKALHDGICPHINFREGV